MSLIGELGCDVTQVESSGCHFIGRKRVFLWPDKGKQYLWLDVAEILMAHIGLTDRNLGKIQ